MGCLFCDQTPESVDAREKLNTIADALGCSVTEVVGIVRHMILAIEYARTDYGQMREERDYWKREVAYYQAYYQRTSSPWWGKEGKETL